MNQNETKKMLSIAAAVIGLILIVSGLYTALNGGSYSAAPVSAPVRKELYEIILGTILLLVGGSYYLWLRGSAPDEAHSTPSKNPLLSKRIPEGRITATIIGISRGLRMEGGADAYHVICQYKEPVSGEMLTYSSKELKDYPGKELIGKHVIVYLHSLDDENYRVDLDTVL